MKSKEKKELKEAQINIVRGMLADKENGVPNPLYDDLIAYLVNQPNPSSKGRTLVKGSINFLHRLIPKKK
jgi:hypothetical protein